MILFLELLSLVAKVLMWAIELALGLMVLAIQGLGWVALNVAVPLIRIGAEGALGLASGVAHRIDRRGGGWQ